MQELPLCRIVDGHCPLPFGTATGAFFIGTHHDASLAYPDGQLPFFASGIADASSSRLMMIGALTARVRTGTKTSQRGAPVTGWPQVGKFSRRLGYKQGSRMTEINETTLTGVVRAEVSFARDKGELVEQLLAQALALADLLQLPDDTMFLPAVCAAMETPTRLDDPASMPFAREIALAAGYGKLMTSKARRKDLIGEAGVGT